MQQQDLLVIENLEKALPCMSAGVKSMPAGESVCILRRGNLSESQGRAAVGNRRS